MIFSSRFAPSPTGYLHSGNARTALFAFFLARQSGGRFILRMEDTDQERSPAELAEAVLDDLHWLGLDWDEGPDCGGPHGPYTQMQRLPLYEEFYARLVDAGAAYPCFCSAETLAAERASQRAQGKAPRYSGHCRALSAADAQALLAAGEAASLRFAVPRSGTLAVADLVWGERRYALADLGDFVIRRSDGSPSFFFANAVDDALMGINLVIRGEDHLSNTPRQILILQALDFAVPQYAHLPLLQGEDGQPLSKRNGAASLRELRAQGYLPAALRNYLGQLGHHYPDAHWRDDAQLIADFTLQQVGRAPAHFDSGQLRYWQEQALQHLDLATLTSWLAPHLAALVPADKLSDFVTALRGNIQFPADAVAWAHCCFQPLVLAAEQQQELRAMDALFWEQARQCYREVPEDFRAWTRALAAQSGRKGRGLYHPLRVALTGRAEGPELAQLIPFIAPEEVLRRLAPLSP
ncbi:glutamate--tRNA ligase [Acidithiobacillus acidisediminis]|uniref:glutamate--tRNA ligase n=1 Tax=Acidithiobacillus acidisediminis TaxID=2937799 RepID=UPI00200BBA2D|nr:glutamate--tRNA ligase [Acidithiobacillus sp. S30A2]